MKFKIILSATILFLIIFSFFKSSAQAPIITYSVSGVQTFSVGSSINPLIPVNTGGAIVKGFGTITDMNITGLNSPYAIAFDNYRRLMYITNYNGSSISKVSLSGTVLKTFTTSANPRGVAVDKIGNIYYADYFNSKIIKIDTLGVQTTFYTNSTFHPESLFIDTANNIYVDDNGNYIDKISADGITVSTIITSSGTSQIGRGLGLDNKGNLYYYTADMMFGSAVIYKLAPDSINAKQIASSQQYDALSVATDGTLYISSNPNIDMISSTGIVSSIANPFYYTSGTAVDASGNVYVAGTNTNQLFIIPGYGYSVSPALPAGLSIDQMTGKISGTPTVVTPTTTYTITAYNNAGKYTTTIDIATSTATGFSIKGIIKTPQGKIIQNEVVKLISAVTDSTEPDNNGIFSFISIKSGNYTLKALKNNDVNKANGVTTLDIALIQSHILGKNLLNSPYKIIAADVNGDGKITTLDLVYIKRLILGLDTTFTNSTTKENRLWAFVDSSYKFPDTTNPFPFKDSISFVGLNANQTNQTFIGVKLGDVNWDWNPTLARMKSQSLPNPPKEGLIKNTRESTFKRRD